ncbi:hypothetical protein WJF77_18500 [Salmonella enterica subsp. enterica serovar Corvallis]|nr:hypothetical protein [Salmonella sp. 3203110320160044]
MLRMTPIASLVLLTLFTWQTQAIATETFDTERSPHNFPKA